MNVLREVVSEYLENRLSLYAAALSFYTILAMGPLFFLLVFFGSHFLPGFEAAVTDVIASLFEEGGTNMVRFVQGYSFTPDGVISASVGIIFLLFIATRLVNILQGALNTLWDRDGQRGLVFRRLVSLALLVLAGLTVVAIMTTQVLVEQLATGSWLSYTSNLAGFCIVVALLTLMYTVLPHPRLPWSTAMRGALVTTFFLILGKSVVNAFVVTTGRYAIGQAVIVLLLWTYYNWHAVLLGSQVAKTFSSSKMLKR